MKRIVLSLAFAGVATLASAQVKPTPTLSPNLAHNVDFRMRQDMIQIVQDQKSGKLSKMSASSLKAKVQAIRKEELADLKVNGTKKLTDAQKTQLNSELDAVQSSL